MGRRRRRRGGGRKAAVQRRRAAQQAAQQAASAQQVQQVIPEAVMEVNGVLMLDMNVLKNYLRLAREELLENASKSQLT